MTAWTADELDRIGRADELRIASRRADGSLRPYVTIWTVRSGDDIYVRSAHGWTTVVPAGASLGRGAGPGGRCRARRRVRGNRTRPDGRVARRLPREIRPLRAVDRRHRGLAGSCPFDPPAGAPLSLGSRGVAVGSVESTETDQESVMDEDRARALVARERRRIEAALAELLARSRPKRRLAPTSPESPERPAPRSSTR